MTTSYARWGPVPHPLTHSQGDSARKAGKTPEQKDKPKPPRTGTRYQPSPYEPLGEGQSKPQRKTKYKPTGAGNVKDLQVRPYFVVLRCLDCGVGLNGVPCGDGRVNTTLRVGSTSGAFAAVWTDGAGGGLAQGLGIRLFAFGGAYWPLATAHSDPLWAPTCFGCVYGAPG